MICWHVDEHVKSVLVTHKSKPLAGRCSRMLLVRGKHCQRSFGTSPLAAGPEGCLAFLASALPQVELGGFGGGNLPDHAAAFPLARRLQVHNCPNLMYLPDDLGTSMQVELPKSHKDARSGARAQSLLWRHCKHKRVMANMVV